MAHTTLVGGTAYNITGGKSMVSGTTYNITGGRVLVGGTGYNISFVNNEPTAMLYSDGNMVFQLGDKVESGKTLTASYTGFDDTSYSTASSVPWNSQRGNIKRVSYDNEIAATSMRNWFYNCRQLTGSPVCGDAVTNMTDAYHNCRNLTGSPVCGDNVTNMSNAYRHCANLTGAPVCGNRVTNMYGTYYNCPNLSGNAYFYSTKVSNVGYCFYNRSRSSPRLNIYAPANSNTSSGTLRSLLRNTSGGSISGYQLNWTNAGSYWYADTMNIYIYPVDNVAAARVANGD